MTKPGDFYVGVIDFFSILLPGALFAAALISIPGFLAIPPLPQLVEAGPTAQWLAFAVSSYALGHFLFTIASKLDGPLYDPYRRRRWGDTKCYNAATTERCGFFGTTREAVDDPMNTFKWSKSLLMLLAPHALGDVNRYEADSKFFRSLLIVLPVVAGVLAFHQHIWVAVTALALTVLAFFCYADRRHKSTEWAYHYAAVLRKLPSGRVRGLGEES